MSEKSEVIMNKHISLIFFLLFSFSLSAENQQLCEPYASIRDLPFDGHGWFANQEPLKYLLQMKSAKTIIEVGSWLGLSTRFLAENQVPEGKVYAVDTWRGPENEPYYMYEQAHRLPHLYQQFLSNVKHAKLTHKIIPVRMSSLEAAEALDVQADLIYIDASHDTKSVLEDIFAWNNHLIEGGYLCGDDWLWPTVQVAVCQAAAILNKKVGIAGNFWWFE